MDYIIKYIDRGGANAHVIVSNSELLGHDCDRIYNRGDKVLSVISNVELLWKELGDVAVDRDECIEEEFLDFPVGTHREEIWHWFEEKYRVPVHELMFPEELHSI